MTSDAPSSRSRAALILMVLIASLSLGGSYLLFFSTRDGSGWGTTNRGEFVTPARTLADLDIRGQSGEPLKEAGTWWLWVVTSSGCDADCEAALHQLRALHVLLNRDAARVRRGLVTARDAAPDARLRARYPQVSLFTGTRHGLAPGIYIVDPIGNLVLRYPFADAGAPVLEDLKRLLKVSQIG